MSKIKINWGNGIVNVEVNHESMFEKHIMLFDKGETSEIYVNGNLVYKRPDELINANMIVTNEDFFGKVKDLKVSSDYMSDKEMIEATKVKKYWYKLFINWIKSI